MSQFVFDLSMIVGGLLFGFFCTFLTIKKYRKTSWYFLWAALFFFFIAGGTSYYKSTHPSADTIVVDQVQPIIRSSLQDSLDRVKAAEIRESKTRPRLSLFMLKLSREKGKPPSIVATVENHGETAATKVRMNFTACVHTVPVYNEFTFSHKPLETADIAPKEKKEIVVYLIDTLKNQMIFRIAAPKFYLFAYGRYMYLKPA